MTCCIATLSTMLGTISPCVFMVNMQRGTELRKSFMRSKKRENFGEEHSLGTKFVLYRAFPETPGLHFKDAILQEKDPVWILCCWVVFPIIVISSEKKGFTFTHLQVMVNISLLPKTITIMSFKSKTFGNSMAPANWIRSWCFKNVRIEMKLYYYRIIFLSLFMKA